jgi:hypothetical protein
MGPARFAQDLDKAIPCQLGSPARQSSALQPTKYVGSLGSTYLLGKKTTTGLGDNSLNKQGSH